MDGVDKSSDIGGSDEESVRDPTTNNPRQNRDGYSSDSSSSSSSSSASSKSSASKLSRESTKESLLGKTAPEQLSLKHSSSSSESDAEPKLSGTDTSDLANDEKHQTPVPTPPLKTKAPTPEPVGSPEIERSSSRPSSSSSSSSSSKSIPQTTAAAEPARESSRPSTSSSTSSDTLDQRPTTPAAPIVQEAQRPPSSSSSSSSASSSPPETVPKLPITQESPRAPSPTSSSSSSSESETEDIAEKAPEVSLKSALLSPKKTTPKTPMEDETKFLKKVQIAEDADQNPKEVHPKSGSPRSSQSREEYEPIKSELHIIRYRKPRSAPARSQRYAAEDSKLVFLRKECDKLERNMKKSAKVTLNKRPKVRPYTPFTWNSLAPYYNTDTLRYLLEMPVTARRGYNTRATASGLVDPELSWKMDHCLTPVTPSRPELFRQHYARRRTKSAKPRLNGTNDILNPRFPRLIGSAYSSSSSGATRTAQKRTFCTASGWGPEQCRIKTKLDRMQQRKKETREKQKQAEK